MANGQISREELWQRGKALYEHDIRQKVETEQNIGKMVIIDVETGDYEVGDAMGIESAHHLRTKHPKGQFFGMRIGYKVAESFGGVMERTT
jgi:hypothetical protein